MVDKHGKEIRVGTTLVNLKSPTWKVEVASVVGEVLTFRSDDPQLDGRRLDQGSVLASNWVVPAEASK